MQRKIRAKAEDGAEVEICTDNPLVPVLGLYDCSYMFFKNIRLGHHVEPGTCGGSVLYAYNTNGIHVEDSDLYGCGTYGLEGSDTSDVLFDNSTIHDCTYGIMYMIGCGGLRFNRCRFLDNQDLDQIYLDSTSTVWFNECEFSGNKVAPQYKQAEFVRCINDCYNISFEGCSFKGNSYATFSTGENVSTTACDFDDN